jgi:penicillin V acylase-like amidase (Ntn superfamily)
MKNFSYERMVLIVAAIGLLLTTLPGYTCSTFILTQKDQLIFAKNYDWHTDYGYVMVNKRDVSKRALVMPPETPADWVSKYGSITFNQVGKEMPMGGINEEGLVIEVMWLKSTRYPEPDNRPAVGELQWIQYHLDTCSTVKEVMAAQSTVRISAATAKIHFLVGDRCGDAASIEFVNGKAVIHYGDSMPVNVLTNNTYKDSLTYLKKHKGFGGNREFSYSVKSLDRFAGAADCIKTYAAGQPGNGIQTSFEILEKISNPPRTVWSIVYDLKKMEVHFKTSRFKELKTFSVADFDFACNTPSYLLDMNRSLKGNVRNQFKLYDTRKNRRLVKATMANYQKNGIAKNVTGFMLEMLAVYPESLSCRTRDHK